MASKWRTWVVDRMGLKQIKETVLDRRVAKAPWYYGDGATLLLLLGVQAGTGIIMTLTYSPTPDTAYDSVRYITEYQTLGWFIRGLHYWSAGLMVVMLFAHVFRQLLVAGYKFPREGTWLIGVLLFFAVLTMAFTGYLLRWDERAVYAITVVLHMFSRVPLIGEYLVLFVQGGAEIGALTLTRLYAVHIIFVPLLMLLLVGYHVYLVMLHGITSPAERKQPIYTAEQQKELYRREKKSEGKGESFFPETAFSSGRMGFAVFTLAVGLTLLYGAEDLYPEANLVDPSMPRSEWWFWWYESIIALVPSVIAPSLVIWFPILLFLAMVLLPFLDRGPHRGIRRRPFMAAFVALCVVGLLVLTEIRWEAPWEGWPHGDPPPVPAGLDLTGRAESGRQLFAAYGCNSCHPVAGQGPRVGPDIALLEMRSVDYFRNYVLAPPEGVPMPAYEGRITEEDLSLVVEFMHAVQTFTYESR